MSIFFVNNIISVITAWVTSFFLIFRFTLEFVFVSKYFHLRKYISSNSYFFLSVFRVCNLVVFIFVLLFHFTFCHPAPSCCYHCFKQSPVWPSNPTITSPLHSSHLRNVIIHTAGNMVRWERLWPASAGAVSAHWPWSNIERSTSQRSDQHYHPITPAKNYNI